MGLDEVLSLALRGKIVTANRWLILGSLFLVRTVMGIQFQSVASVSPLMVQDLGMSYAQLGILIGLYDLPGVFLAFPGGLLGRRYGDKRVAVTGLALMALGGLVMGASRTYPEASAGRLLSGMGAILLNVLLTKMTTDWFIGRELVLSLGILVSSFPFALGLALLSLGPLAAATSWQAVMFLISALSLAGLVLVAAIYRDPPLSDARPARWAGFRLSGREVGLAAVAGTIWALFNSGLATLPSFGTGFLISAGYTIAAAGAMVSAMAWLLIPSVQLGAYLAERVRRPNVILVACFVGAGLATCVLPYWPYPLALCIALGLLFGPPPESSCRCRRQSCARRTGRPGWECSTPAPTVGWC